jgi:hypothetical protein
MPAFPASFPRTLLKRRWLRWSVTLLLAYTIFGFLILPLIVRAIAIKQISAQLDRQASIRRVRLNPYVLSGTIQGLLIKDKDGEPFLAWDEVYGNFQLSSFFGKAWVFKEVRASKPFIRVQINKDYTFNFSDLLKKFSANPSAPSTPGKPLRLEIGQFRIAGALAQLTDLTPATPFHRSIGPLELTLTAFHTDPNSRNPYSFAGTTDGGERFSWSGYFSLDPIRSAGEVSLEGVSIPKYAPLYQDLVRFEIRDGVVDFRSAYNLTFAGTNWLGGVSNAAMSLKNFRAGDRTASNNVIELDMLAIQGLSADTGARTAQISNVSLDGGRIAVKREPAGDLNLMALTQPADGATNTPGGILFLLQTVTNAVAALVNTTNLWSGTLQELQLTNCALTWDDGANRRPVHAIADNIAIAGKHLSNVPGSNQTATLSLRWNTNGSVRIEAVAQIGPPSADISLKVSDMDLQPIDPYLEPFINVYVRRSKLGIDGHLHMRTATNGLPDVTFAGSASLNDFASVDGLAENDLIKWNSFQIEGLQAALSPPNINIKTVSLTEPAAHLVIETNNAINFLAVLKSGPTNEPPPIVAPEPAARAASAPKGGIGARFGAILRQALESNTNVAGASLPAITVETIAISNGIVQFEDRSVQPPVHTTVEAINGTVSGVSSSELKRADILLSGKANRTGPFEITGKINPLSTNASTALLVKFNEVDLSPVSPYSGKFLGYKLNRGLLNLAVNYEVTGRKLTASNLLVLDHFTLGEKVESPAATKLPVRLAVALLKDRNGRIQLDVPIEGSLDDPEFHFGKAITRVIVNVVTKLVTSPFAALGSLFGGKGEEVSFIQFQPGRSDSAPGADQKIETLLRGLQERPALQLEIAGSFDPVSDSAGLRREKLDRELRRHKWSSLRKAVQARTKIEDVELSDGNRKDALKALYRAVMKTNNPAVKSAVSERGPQSKPAIPAGSKLENSGPASDRGAVLLVRPSTPAKHSPPADSIEGEVLNTIQVTDTDLRNLAVARAQSIHKKLSESGKIETERLLLAEQLEAGTNQAARVFFNLR